MKTYSGYRLMQRDNDNEAVSCRCVVRVQDGDQRYDLPLRLDLRNHSPTGFEWGYGGSGPAQLALALVADALGANWAVAPIYQRVKEALVSKLAHEGWQLTQEQIGQAANAARKEANP